MMIQAIVFLLLISVSTAKAAEPATATLAQKWNISEDVSSAFSGLSFELGFTVSDYISNYDPYDDESNIQMARVNIYDHRCQEDGVVINSNTLGIESIIVDTTDLDDPRQEGLQMNREVTVNVTIDAVTITKNNLLYSEYIDITSTSTDSISAEIKICFRFSLYTPSGTPLEVNYQGALVSLKGNSTLEGNNSTNSTFEKIESMELVPYERPNHTSVNVYQFNAFLCDLSNAPEPNDIPFEEGTVFRVCVEPDEDALDDGIRMRSIDDFIWSRTVPNVVNQPAIIGPNKEARNNLTSITCIPGSDMCSFETVLFTAFFTDDGTVTGSGIATMQFGTADSLGDDTTAAAAEFELEFDVVAMSPTHQPSTSPTTSPSLLPSAVPTASPSLSPTVTPESHTFTRLSIRLEGMPPLTDASKVAFEEGTEEFYHNLYNPQTRSLLRRHLAVDVSSSPFTSFVTVVTVVADKPDEKGNFVMYDQQITFSTSDNSTTEESDPVDLLYLPFRNDTNKEIYLNLLVEKDDDFSKVSEVGVGVGFVSLGESSDEGLSIGAIIGIVISALVGLCCCCCGAASAFLSRREGSNPVDNNKDLDLDDAFQDEGGVPFRSHQDDEESPTSANNTPSSDSDDDHDDHDDHDDESDDEDDDEIDEESDDDEEEESDDDE